VARFHACADSEGSSEVISVVMVVIVIIIPPLLAGENSLTSNMSSSTIYNIMSSTASVRRKGNSSVRLDRGAGHVPEIRLPMAGR
jgi:hypothetical protein